MTNVAGAARWRKRAFGATADQGLRTLAGGQLSIQVEGYLAIQTDAAPPLVVERPHAARDIFAVVREAPSGGSRSSCNLRQNSSVYCTLTIADGATTSNVVNGFGLAPLAAGSHVNLDITSVPTAAGTLAGQRSDGDDPALMKMPDKLETDARPGSAVLFLQPSAIAALSGASASWIHRVGDVAAAIRLGGDRVESRQRRTSIRRCEILPDGDLSGLVLTYEETRTNCIPLDSDLFATVDWPTLRVWATPAGDRDDLLRRLERSLPSGAIAGSYQSAYADFTLSGTVTPGDYVGLAYLGDHYTYQYVSGDILANAALAIVDAINASPLLRATRTGTTIRVYYTNGTSIGSSTTGANGNRFGMYSYASSSTGGSSTAAWDFDVQTFANGTSPTEWQLTIDFSSLAGYLAWPPPTGATPVSIPTSNIRKLRWTYTADLQPGTFARSEFEVAVSNWTVTGTNRGYSIAGPGTRRIEDHDAEMTYSGTWTESRGNYSGGSIHRTTTPGDSVTLTYNAIEAHTLYAGTRYLATGAQIAFAVDGASAGALNLLVPQEDVLIRWPVGDYAAGSHTITICALWSGWERFLF